MFNKFKIIIIYSLYIIILLCDINASETEEFYVFPMGQGNGQLVIFHQGEKSIGVLYDLGSKSLQLHPKLSSRGNWELNFLTKKETEEELADISVDFDHMFSEEQDETYVTPVKPPRSIESFSLNAKLSTPQRDILKTELQLFIRDKLINLKHLFIFLSHSDEDHINYINKTTIPDELPVTIFLAGDWFGNVGCKKNENNITKSVKNVISFLINRIKSGNYTKFSFPYYLNFNILKEDGESIDFNRFIEQSFINTEDWEESVNILAQYCLRTNINTPNPVFFSGRT